MTATNQNRSNWAEFAVWKFARITQIENEHDSVKLQDLLTDLRHYANQHNLDYDNLDEQARQMYEEELQQDN